jgi:hypothetical protein
MLLGGTSGETVCAQTKLMSYGAASSVGRLPCGYCPVVLSASSARSVVRLLATTAATTTRYPATQPLYYYCIIIVVSCSAWPETPVFQAQTRPARAPGSQGDDVLRRSRSSSARE